MSIQEQVRLAIIKGKSGAIDLIEVSSAGERSANVDVIMPIIKGTGILVSKEFHCIYACQSLDWDVIENLHGIEIEKGNTVLNLRVSSAHIAFSNIRFEGIFEDGMSVPELEKYVFYKRIEAEKDFISKMAEYRKP